jgi:transcriptional coactivator p15 (PC4)
LGSDGPCHKKLKLKRRRKKLPTSSAGSVRAAGKDTKAKDEMQIVNTFAKNAFDEVWSYLQPFKGHDLAHIRVFTLGDDDEMYPRKKGITLNVSDLPKLAEAVAALVAAVEARTS